MLQWYIYYHRTNQVRVDTSAINVFVYVTCLNSTFFSIIHHIHYSDTKYIITWQTPDTSWHDMLYYGVATISRLLKIICLFCKRALYKRRYSAKETWYFKEPTNRSHPIYHMSDTNHSDTITASGIDMYISHSPILRYLNHTSYAYVVWIIHHMHQMYHHVSQNNVCDIE